MALSTESHHKNAYDLLRLILAVLVLVSHASLIGGYGSEALLSLSLSKGAISLGDVGVMGFFTLSGYLISASFERSRNGVKFLFNRVLRIFPGFWVCLIVSAFVLAPAIYYTNHHSLTSFPFLGAGGAMAFVYQNAMLNIRQWSVGDVLSNSVYKESLNGSLWSLFPEMQCYIATLLLGLCGILRNNRFVFLLVFGFSYIIYAVNIIAPVHYGPTIFILSNAFRLYVCYLCGTFLFIYGERISIDRKGYIFLGLFALLLLKFSGFLIVAPIIIAVFCVKLFGTFKVSFKYDISYGMYIYAFPVEQLVFNVFNKSVSMPVYILISLLITAILAFASFRLVEQPFLKLKK